MRSLLRIFLWTMKGALLAIALAALVMWPVSRGRRMWALAQRYTIEPQRVNFLRWLVVAQDGRIMVGWYDDHYFSEQGSQLRRTMAEAHGAGWTFKHESVPSTQFYATLSRSWGPIRWQYGTLRNSDFYTIDRYLAAPCYVIALAAAAWPLTSLALRLNRQIKRRRAAREGCCKKCGYDLRATPDKGGALLPVCPECGAPQKSDL